MMFQDVLTFAQPYLVEAIAAIFAGVLYRLLGGVVARDTLHSALRTGASEVAFILEDRVVTKEELIERAVSYARKSSPAAIRRLGASDDVLRSIAAAKLGEIVGRKA